MRGFLIQNTKIMAFAKILDSEKYGQVLIHKDFNEDNDPTLIIKVRRSEAYISAKITHTDSEFIDKAFETIDIDKAEKFLNEALLF